MLIVYVDDLLLSGPSELHAGFWKDLAEDVNLDPPEDIDRYLGRHHTYVPCERTDCDLFEFFESPIVA